MTDEDLEFLKSQVDQVVLLETKEGEAHLGQILFVFDEGETPDVFYLRAERDASGTFVTQAGEGRSVLLSDIVSVRPPSA